MNLSVGISRRIHLAESPSYFVSIVPSAASCNVRYHKGMNTNTNTDNCEVTRELGIFQKIKVTVFDHDVPENLV